MQNRVENGLVVRVTGGEVRVAIAAGTVACRLRGRLRLGGRGGVVAGDRVRVAMPERDEDSPAIESVEERTSSLSRFIEREARERVIVANIERLFVVAAIAEPPFHAGFVDRVLVSAEYGHIPPCLVINKTDLAAAGDVDAIAATYTSCGYEVLATSANSGDGVDAVVSRLGDGVYAFVGESGVGKSSLLMRIDPSLDLRVNEIGEKTGRGRHTTTNSELFPFRDGYLADTPGVQTFGFAGENKLKLPDCFPEFAPHLDCRFSPCTHSHEPGCGVKAAVEAGEIATSRHESYTAILAEVEAREKRKQW